MFSFHQEDRTGQNCSFSFAVLLQERWTGVSGDADPQSIQARARLLGDLTSLNPFISPVHVVWGQENGAAPGRCLGCHLLAFRGKTSQENWRRWSSCWVWVRVQRCFRRVGMGARRPFRGQYGRPGPLPVRKPYTQISAEPSGQAGGSHTPFPHRLQQRHLYFCAVTKFL